MILYDASDTVFFKGNESKEWVNLEDISDDLINATISTEDKYYKATVFAAFSGFIVSYGANPLIP